MSQGLMRARWAVLIGFLALSMPCALAAGQTKFWNTTGDKIIKFELAPAGSGNWGPDQCKNDKDNSVDDDERLQIKDVATGSYDARMTFEDGRVCTAKAIQIVQGKIFSLERGDLKDCTNPH
ncbi:MAG TPA: hypothetical protein VKV77_01155 [Methylovirgula sp.]|nr:hypothetical protein [Methylovirgula sp.]